MKESSLLETILEIGSLTILFQPIFEICPLTVQLHSLECLARGPKGTNLERADILFEYIRKKRSESIIDRICIKSIFSNVRLLPTKPNLSINVHAATLERDPKFVDFIHSESDKIGLPFSNLTLEVIEHAPLWNSANFFAALENLRKLGAAIALDDVGLGQSNYKMILDCSPNYLKIDRHFVKQAHSDLKRRAILESICVLAQKINARTIAEGVEIAADLDVLMEIGIDLFQGYLLLPPIESSDLADGELLGENFIPSLLKLREKHRISSVLASNETENSLKVDWL